VIVEDDLELEPEELEPEPEKQKPQKPAARSELELDLDRLGTAIGRGVGAAVRDLGLGTEKPAQKPAETPPAPSEKPQSEHGDPGEPKREPYRRGILSWFFDG
jgi:hypothetical protein